MQDLAWHLVTNTGVPNTDHSDMVSFEEVAVVAAVEPDAEGPNAEMDALDVPGGPRSPLARDRSNDAPLGAWVAFALIGFGVLAEITERTEPRGLLLTILGIMAVIVARLAAGRTASTDARVRWSRNAAAAVGIGASFGLIWRANTTLRVLDVLAVLVSVALVSDVWLQASLLFVRRMVRMIVTPIIGFFRAIAMGGQWIGQRYRSRFGSTAKAGGLAASVKKRRALIVQIGAGVVLAVPVVAVLGMLLASADAVFASFFRVPEFDLSGLGEGVGSLVRIAFYALLLAAPIVAGIAHQPAKVSDSPDYRPVGRVEALVLFVAVDVLFGLFCIAQLVTLGGGAKRVLTTSGLTYAEYARSGFFQLVTVAILTLMVLGGIRAAIGEVAASDLKVKVLSSLTCLLTLAITLVALNRMSLYIRAYGLTVERIVAQAGTITIGCIFVLVLCGILGSQPGRDLRGWTTAGALGVAALAIVILHVANPSAWSMRDGFRRSNVDRGGSDGIVRNDPRVSAPMEIDNDSLPVVSDWLRENPSNALANALRRQLCSEVREPRSWYQWEWSAMRADQARSEVCNVSR